MCGCQEEGCFDYECQQPAVDGDLCIDCQNGEHL